LEGGAGTAPCVTVTLRPAIVRFADRADDVAAAENATLPGPVPDAPLVIVSHVAPLVELQVGRSRLRDGGLSVAVTVIAPVPPPLVRLTLVVR
jgi:hypothetical protein